MKEIETIFKLGEIPQELKSQIKKDILLSKRNAKKRELERNEWITYAKKIIKEGADSDVVLSGLSSLLRIHDGHEEEGLDIKVGFSPGKDCKNLIISHLSDAKKSIKICVFTISDNDIADLIIRAHKRGIDVKVIADNEKAEDAGSDIKRIAEEGIPIKIDFTTNHMHHKFSITDDEEVLTGSYNWTRSAEQYNQENLVVIKNDLIATCYKDEFEKLWKNLMDY